MKFSFNPTFRKNQRAETLLEVTIAMFFKKPLHRPEGVSLLIAMIFVAALIIVAVGLAETQLNALRDFRDMNRTTEADLAAKSVLNLVMGQAIRLAKQETNPLRGLNLSGEGSGVRETFDNSTPGEIIKWYFNTIPFCKQNPTQCSFSYKVLGKPDTQLVTSFGSYYSVPAAYSVSLSGGGTKVKPTGDAAENCEFDINNDTQIDESDRQNADNPCHWNKISLHNAKEIPLYYARPDGTIVNPKDSDGAFPALNEMVLRVRVPCMKEVEVSGKRYREAVPWCKENPPSLTDPKRPELYPGDSQLNQRDKIRTMRKDDILIYWNILGDFSTPEDKRRFGDVLFMLQGHDATTKKKNSDSIHSFDPTKENPKSWFNTEITASRINCATNWPCFYPLFDPRFEMDNAVLNQDIWGYDIYNQVGSILNFIKDLAANNIVSKRTGTAGDPAWNQRTITKPRLQIEALNDPRDAWLSDANGNSTDPTKPGFHLIPYLEYQVLTNRPIADEKIFAEADVTLGDISRFAKSTKKFEIDTAFFTVSTN